jgi:preprotein translocase subunit SecD
MSKISKIFSNFRIWIFIIVLLIAIAAISPNPWNSGVAIRTIALNSSAYDAGIMSPSQTEMPMGRERIVEIQSFPVSSIRDYEEIIQEIPADTRINIVTEKNRFFFFPERTVYNVEFRSPEQLGIKVYDAPQSNILLGLDLQGGTRVVLQPEERLTSADMDILLQNMEERLNVFGLSDTTIRSASDLAGNQFIVVEIAGASEEEVKDLLARQGKFEAKVGNETIFVGGRDVTFVCRTAECSGIDPQYGCRQAADGTHLCRFRFSITLSREAAERMADATRNLNVVYDEFGQSYLSENIDLYLDDVLVDSLRIGSELRGNVVTEISISGSGAGRSRQEAQADTQLSMKRLQTILITGSLPVRLDIIKTDTLSPSLGREFLQNAIWIAILAQIAVVAVIITRYKKVKIAIPIVTIITSEILLILGISSILKQNIDIAGIAGILVAIGTGVDDQIVITDETLSKEADEKYLTWANRLKKAFFIIFAAYFTTLATMAPLLFAGAGLLKGFAVTTIIGVTSGVLVTRPAFAELMRILVGDED